MLGGAFSSGRQSGVEGFACFESEDAFAALETLFVRNVRENALAPAHVQTDVFNNGFKARAGAARTASFASLLTP